MNWADIAEKCGTTAGAASKRYSRMKQAFDAGGDAPASNSGSPAPKTPSKATPRKKNAAAADAEGADATPTKRKRATPKKVISEDSIMDDDEDVGIKPEPEVEDDSETEQMITPKKVKATKPKVTPKPRATPKPKATSVENDLPIKVYSMKPTTEVKAEVDDDVMDTIEAQPFKTEAYVKNLVDEDNGNDESTRK